MDSFEIYNGKPTVYLDHNILDLFVKGQAGDLDKQVLDKYQVVFSDENLKEIKRSVGYEKYYLDALQKLNPYHLKIIIQQPGFIISDKATLTDVNVYEAFDAFIENDSKFSHYQNALGQYSFKFFGGRKTDDIATINTENYETISALLSESINNEYLPIELKNKLTDQAELIKHQLKKTHDEIESNIKKHSSNIKNLDLISLYRNAIQLSPKQLNNITESNIIEQIWNLCDKELLSQNGINDLDEFFNIKEKPIQHETPYHLHQKITAMYNTLNIIGYYQDSNLNKERRFISAMSDNSHASMASFCTLLLSRDEYFIKKVRAVYEYFCVPTQIGIVSSA